MLRIFLLSCFVLACSSEEHHGPFGKVHSSSLNIPNPFNCNRTLGLVSRFSLNVSSPTYANGQVITVTWVPQSSPCQEDFLGIFFVDEMGDGACDYLDFEFIIEGMNNASWTMINLRRQLEFRYYTREENCTGNYSFVGQSSIVQPVNFNEPTQIHLAFADQLSEMFVSFTSNSNLTVPQCQFGLTNDSLELHADGRTESYAASDMCEGKANLVGPQSYIHPGYLHTVRLTDLRPSTIYFYRVGNDQDGWSSIYEFLTRPPLNDEHEVNLIAYGDMGVTPIQSGARATIDRVLLRAEQNNVTAILHIGDLSYARGIGALWEAYMDQIELASARFPYMVGIGNHEYDHVTGGDKDPSKAPGPGGFRPVWGNYGTDSGGECAVPTVHRFHSPSNGNGLFWYSFDVGPVHVVYYSTEHDFRRSSEQHRWLENDLRSVDRQRTPWVIVGGHRPMYSSLVGVDLIRLMLQLHVEPLLYKYHVDLNMFAHIHSYERTCPMYQQRCVSDGVTHILIGMGGHDLTYGSYLDEPWSIFHDIQFGYTHLFANRTHLNFYYYHTFADDQPADHFQLQKY